MMRYEFVPMHTIIPPGKSGNVSIEHFEVSEEASKATQMRAAFGHPDEYVSPGKYCRLLVNGDVMMSDTQNEQRTNYAVVRAARGRVLIAGLGLGMVVVPIFDKAEVKSVLVIEKSPDVIKLVEPHLQHAAPGKLQVIEADIFEWKPEKGSRFDTIYFDIWPNICTDNLDGMAKLHQRFCHYRAADGWMNSWERDLLKYRRGQERRQEREWSYFRRARP
jgi:hypothetical protein